MHRLSTAGMDRDVASATAPAPGIPPLPPQLCAHAESASSINAVDEETECCACQVKKLSRTCFDKSLGLSEPEDAVFCGQLCNICVDRITTKVPGTEGRVLRTFYVPSRGNQDFDVATNLGKGHDVSTTSAASAAAAAAAATTTIQPKKEEGEGEGAGAGAGKIYCNEPVKDNKDKTSRSAKSPSSAASAVDATTSIDDACREGTECCACKVRKPGPSCFDKSQDINESIYHRHMCNECVTDLTFEASAGVRTFKKLGVPRSSPFSHKNASTQLVDLGNGVKVSVIREVDDDKRRKGVLGLKAAAAAATQQMGLLGGRWRDQFLESKAAPISFTDLFGIIDGSSSSSSNEENDGFRREAEVEGRVVADHVDLAPTVPNTPEDSDNGSGQQIDSTSAPFIRHIYYSNRHTPRPSSSSSSSSSGSSCGSTSIRTSTTRSTSSPSNTGNTRRSSSRSSTDPSGASLGNLARPAAADDGDDHTGAAEAEIENSFFTAAAASAAVWGEDVNDDDAGRYHPAAEAQTVHDRRASETAPCEVKDDGGAVAARVQFWNRQSIGGSAQQGAAVASAGAASSPKGGLVTEARNDGGGGGGGVGGGGSGGQEEKLAAPTPVAGQQDEPPNQSACQDTRKRREGGDRQGINNSDFSAGYKRGVLHCGLCLVVVGLVKAAVWSLGRARLSG